MPTFLWATVSVAVVIVVDVESAPLVTVTELSLLPVTGLVHLVFQPEFLYPEPKPDHQSDRLRSSIHGDNVSTTAVGDAGTVTAEVGEANFLQAWTELDRMARLVFDCKALDGNTLLDTPEASQAFTRAVFGFDPPALPSPSSSGRTRRPQSRSVGRSSDRLRGPSTSRPGPSRRRDVKLNTLVLHSDDDVDEFGNDTRVGRRAQRDARGRFPGPLDCPRLLLPTPAPTQQSKTLDDAALKESLQTIATASKNKLFNHRDHGCMIGGCFGKRSNSVRGVSIVQRGSPISIRQIQRWTSGPNARPGDEETFFNADPSYYHDDGYALNPRKPIVQEYSDFEYSGTFNTKTKGEPVGAINCYRTDTGVVQNWVKESVTVQSSTTVVVATTASTSATTASKDSSSSSSSTSSSSSSASTSTSASSTSTAMSTTSPNPLGNDGNTADAVASGVAACTSGGTTVAGGSAGEEDLLDDDEDSPMVIDERDAIDIDADTDAFLYPAILRPPRSFEFKARKARVNVGGIMLHVAFEPFVDCDHWSGKKRSECTDQKEWLMKHHTKTIVMDDVDPHTGSMEDRRSDWLIDRRITQAEAKADDEYRRTHNLPPKVSTTKPASVLTSTVSEEKRFLKRSSIRNRCAAANRAKIYMTGGDKIADTYLGRFRTDLGSKSDFMAGRIVETKADGTTSTTWAERVDSTAAYTYEDVEFAENEYINPDIDSTLVRAEDNSKINEVWATCYNRMVKEADRKAGMALSIQQMETWVRDSDEVMDDKKSSEDSIITTVDSVTSSVASLSVSPPTGTAESAQADQVDAGNISIAGPIAADAVGPTDVGAAVVDLVEPIVGPQLSPPAAAAADAVDNDDDVPDRVNAGPVAPKEGDSDDWLGPLARQHSDEIIDAVATDGVVLSHVDEARLKFFSNLVYRMDNYRTTGDKDQVLIDQITMG